MRITRLMFLVIALAFTYVEPSFSDGGSAPARLLNQFQNTVKRLDAPTVGRAVTYSKDIQQKIFRESENALNAAKVRQNGMLEAAQENQRRAQQRVKKNKPLKDEAVGPHSTYKTNLKGKITKYETWKPNSQNPSGFDSVKRVATQYGPTRTHRNKVTGEKVSTPFVRSKTIPGGVRSAYPSELPK